MTRLSIVASLLGALALTSCVTQPIPTHGGGKRFFFEQHLVTTSADDAISQLDFESLRDHRGAASLTGDPTGFVRVWVVAVADEGGGVGGDGQTSREFMFGSDPETAYAAYASDSGRDVKYIETKVCQVLEAGGIATHITQSNPGEASGDLFVLVSEFGTSKSGFSILVYSEREFAARTALEAFYVSGTATADGDRTYLHLGRGDATATMYQEFLLGAGPINSPEDTFFLTRGPIPGAVEPSEVSQ